MPIETETREEGEDEDQERGARMVVLERKAPSADVEARQKERKTGSLPLLLTMTALSEAKL